MLHEELFLVYSCLICASYYAATAARPWQDLTQWVYQTYTVAAHYIAPR